MKFSRTILPLLSCVWLLTSCAVEPMASRTLQTTAYPQVATARFNLPALPEGYMRLYIYRPQAFVGMMDNPVISLDGKPMGNPKNPYENRFQPGALFVVDTPATTAQASWLWEYEKTDKVLTLSTTQSRIWYLRWHIPPFNFPGERYLEVTTEANADKEIPTLRFTGYIKLERP